MELTQAIEYALDGDAILFAGSGFSYGAENADGEPFKTGLQLRDYLATECGLSSTDASLENVATYYEGKKTADDLISAIRKVFSLGKVANHHNTIMDVYWKRVYTTNYDEVIEVAGSNNGRVITPIAVSANIDDYPKEDICIHINGYIKNLNRDTINEEFKLVDRSYAAETLDGSPWFEFMKKDFKSAKAIIIVGFSMQSDLDIKRIIAPPAISSKVVFVTKPGLDDIDKSILSNYATVEEIGVQELATKIESQKTQHHNSPLHYFNFTAFSFEHMAPSVTSVVEYSDLVEFYYSGTPKDNLYEKNAFGDYVYLINRKATDAVISKLYNYKIFLAVSHIGNGKTVFCNLVRNELRELDVYVLTYKERAVDIDKEISKIATIAQDKRCVIIIDNYYAHFDVLSSFKDYGHENIVFILTSRQAINNVTYRKLLETLNVAEDEIYPIYLNSLKDKEPQELADVLNNNKLLTAHVKYSDAPRYYMEECQGQLSAIVLDMFKSSYVKKEYDRLFTESVTKESKEVKLLAIFAICTSVFNLEISFSEMVQLLDMDYVLITKGNNQILNELFDVVKDTVSVRSSIVAREILHSIISINDFVDTLILVFLKADKSYATNKSINEMLRALMSHSNFIGFMHSKDTIGAIKKFYDSIRNTSFCKNNPFFWEQFASACIDAKDYETAFQCIEVAYAEAKKIPHFVPFQISTIHGRCILEELIRDMNTSKISAESAIDKLTVAHECLIKYYKHPENNHYFIFKNVNHYLKIYDFYQDIFDARQLSIFIEKLGDMHIRCTEYIKTGATSHPSTPKWNKEYDEYLENARKEHKALLK